jgi:hypothetical protein
MAAEVTRTLPASNYDRRLLVPQNQGMAKRGYSREFTPQTERRVRFEVDRIPPTLYEAVKAKAKREGVSMRALTLQLWKDWAASPDTKGDPR